MRHYFLSWFVVFGLIVCPAARGETPAAPASRSSNPAGKTFDLGSFSGELRNLAAKIRATHSHKALAALGGSLPESWTVSIPEQSYSIRTDPLRVQLNAGSQKNAEAWLQHLQMEIDGSQTHAVPTTSARTELNRILARPEFASVRPPSAWDLMRQRVLDWIERMLIKLFGGIARHPVGAEVLFWLLIVGAVAFVALMVFRFLSSRDKMELWQPESTLVTQRTWQEWLRMARTAANRNDFREAVHSSYWAGIARLEDLNVVPRDRSKTPREYLRALSEANAADAASPFGAQAPLSNLTSELERTWYANRGASSDDFVESLRQLEALGCPLE